MPLPKSPENCLFVVNHKMRNRAKIGLKKPTSFILHLECNKYVEGYIPNIITRDSEKGEFYMLWYYNTNSKRLLRQPTSKLKLISISGEGRTFKAYKNPSAHKMVNTISKYCPEYKWSDIIDHFLDKAKHIKHNLKPNE